MCILHKNCWIYFFSDFSIVFCGFLLNFQTQNHHRFVLEIRIFDFLSSFFFCIRIVFHIQTYGSDAFAFGRPNKFWFDVMKSFLIDFKWYTFITINSIGCRQPGTSNDFFFWLFIKISCYSKASGFSMSIFRPFVVLQTLHIKNELLYGCAPAENWMHKYEEEKLCLWICRHLTKSTIHHISQSRINSNNKEPARNV